MVSAEQWGCSYDGRGDTGPYAVTFPVQTSDSGDALDVAVWLVGPTGARTNITSTSTISGLNVYTAEVYDDTYTVHLLRDPDLVQQSNYEAGTKFPASRFERDLDYLTFCVHKVWDRVRRAWALPVGSDDADDLPTTEDLAGGLLAFNAEGKPIAAAGSLAVPVSAFAATLLDDETAADARATLGAAAGDHTHDTEYAALSHDHDTDYAALSHDHDADYAAIDHSHIALVPTGTILPFGGTSLPDGYLWCRGDTVSRTTYAALFSAIGTAFGTGDGSTTFNLPDLRGEFLRGVDHGRGADPNAATRTGGDAVGSTQTDAMQGHKHDYVAGNYTNQTNPGSYIGDRGYSTQQTGVPVTDGTNGTPRTSSETRPRNVNVEYIIKY